MGIALHTGTAFEGCVLAMSTELRYGVDNTSYPVFEARVWDAAKRCVRVLGEGDVIALGAVIKWVEMGSYLDRVPLVEGTVDATPEVRALAAAYAARERAEAERARVVASFVDAGALIAAGIYPAVRVTSTRTKLPVDTVHRVIEVGYATFNGDALRRFRVDPATTGTSAPVWLGAGTFEVLGATSEAALCLATAAALEGYDAQLAVELFEAGALDVSALPLPGLAFGATTARLLLKNAGYSLQAWRAAVVTALGPTARLDNNARVVEWKAAQARARKDAAAKKRAAARAAKTA